MINILPYNERKIIDRVRILRIITTLIWSLVILVLVGTILYFPTLITINSRYAIALNQMRLLEKSGTIISPVDVTSLDTRTRTLQAKLAATLSTTPIEYLSIARKLTPGDVNVTGFSVTKNTLQITGIATTRRALQSYISILQNNSSIQSVDSPVSNFVKSVRIPFTISVTFKTQQ